MAMHAHPSLGYLNISLTGGIDYAGAWLLSTFRALVASGRYEWFGQGDGLAVVSTNQSDIFTANTNGWKTSGTFATNVANSVSNPRAWGAIREKNLAGALTGRQFFFQRGSGSAAGNDRFNIVAFSLAGLSGAATATAPYSTGTYHSIWAPGAAATFGGVGNNLFTDLSGSPFLGGSGTLTYSVLTPDGVSNGDVCPWASTIRTATGDGAGLFYESVDASETTSYPLLLGGDTIARLFGGDTLSGVPASFNSSAQPIFSYSEAGAQVLCSFETVPGPDGTNRPSNTTPVQTETGSTYQIRPLWVEKDSATSCTPFGRCESLKYHFPGGTAWMDCALFFAATPHATERAAVSWGVVNAPWLVGQALDSSPGNRTDMRTVIPDAAIPDTTDPVIGAFSPVAGDVDTDQAVTVHATDVDSGVAFLVVWVDYGTRLELAYIGDGTGSYQTGYTGGSSVSGTAADYTLVTVPDAGWAGDCTVHVTAVDAAGNQATSSIAYTVPGAGVTVTWLDLPGSTLQSKRDTIDFVVSSVAGLVLAAILADGKAPELVWTLAGGFTYPYRDSTYTPLFVEEAQVTQGTFAVRRAPSWQSDIDMAVLVNGVRIDS